MLWTDNKPPTTTAGTPVKRKRLQNKSFQDSILHIFMHLVPLQIRFFKTQPYIYIYIYLIALLNCASENPSFQSEFSKIRQVDFANANLLHKPTKWFESDFRVRSASYIILYLHSCRLKHIWPVKLFWRMFLSVQWATFDPIDLYCKISIQYTYEV